MRTVLQWLGEKKSYVKFSKYEFWLESMYFLGHVVINDCIMVDSVKVARVGFDDTYFYDGNQEFYWFGKVLLEICSVILY